MPQKNLIPGVIFSCAVLTAFLAAVPFAKEVEPLSQTQSTTNGFEVSLRVVRMLPDRREFELLAHNSSRQSVFIITAPVRSNGSRGSYFAKTVQYSPIWSRSFPNSPSPLNRSIAPRQLEHAHCIVVKDSFPMLARDGAFVGVEVGFHRDEWPVAAEH